MPFREGELIGVGLCVSPTHTISGNFSVTHLGSQCASEIPPIMDQMAKDTLEDRGSGSTTRVLYQINEKHFGWQFSYCTRKAVPRRKEHKSVEGDQEFVELWVVIVTTPTRLTKKYLCVPNAISRGAEAGAREDRGWPREDRGRRKAPGEERASHRLIGSGQCKPSQFQTSLGQSAQGKIGKGK